MRWWTRTCPTTSAPHVELMKSVARRVSDGRMLGWVKTWLEMAVEEDDGKGGKRRTNRARKERHPARSADLPITQQPCVVSFWAGRCYAQNFCAKIVNWTAWCSAKRRPARCWRQHSWKG